MGHFSGDLHLVKPLGSKLFKVTEPYTYHYSDDIEVYIPAGTTSDMASVPAPFRILVPRVGRFDAAAVMHDELYRHQSVIDLLTLSEIPITRKLADDIFLQAMIDLDVSVIQRNMIYAGVRIGGWLYWKRCKDC